MSSDDEAANLKLEKVFADAASANAQALAVFFQAFLDGPLHVPERRQAEPLTNTAAYPNDFVTFLGISQSDRNIVPVFTRKLALSNWAGRELSSMQLSGKDLLARLPQEWWIVVNPGSELTKEISPWEVELLTKEGLAAVPAIAEELKGAEESEPFRVAPVPPAEYAEARAALSQAAGTLPEISRMFLLKENLFDEEDMPQDSLLIAAESEQVEAARKAVLLGTLRDAVGKVLIGENFKVKVLTKDEDLMHGMLVHFEPFYSRPGAAKGGLLSKLFGK